MSSLYVMFMVVSNHMGVLARIASVFHRKLLNIRYLTVVEDTDANFAHITVWAEGDPKDADGAYKLLSNQEDIHSITFADNNSLIEREMILVKAPITEQTQSILEELHKDFEFKILRYKEDVVILEYLGSLLEIKFFLDRAEALNPTEVSRAGITAMSN